MAVNDLGMKFEWEPTKNTNTNSTQKGYKVLPGGSVIMLGKMPPDMSKWVRSSRRDLGEMPQDYRDPEVIRGKVSLESLMTYTDLIVIGTVKRILRARGDYDYLINGELITYVELIEIERIVASVWDQPETLNRLSLSKNDSTNTFYLIIHPFVKANPPRINDTILENKGRYLLWLDYYPMEGADAKKYDLCGTAMYKTTIGRRGTLRIHKSMLASLLFKWKRKSTTASIKKSFNTTNPTKIIAAVSCLAKGMAKSASKEEAVIALAAARAKLSLPTNSFSRLEGVRRFRTVDMRLPE